MAYGYGGGGLLPDWLVFGNQPEEYRQNAMLGGTPDWGFNDRFTGGGAPQMPQYDISGRYGRQGLPPETMRGLGEATMIGNDPNLPPGPVPQQQMPGLAYAQQPPQQQQPQQPLANFPPQQQSQQQAQYQPPEPGIGDRLSAAGRNLLMMTIPTLGVALQGLRTGRGPGDQKQQMENAALQAVQSDDDLTPQLKRALLGSSDLSVEYISNKLKKLGGNTADLLEYQQWQKEGGKGNFEYFLTKVKQQPHFSIGQPQYSIDPDDPTKLIGYQQSSQGGLRRLTTPDGSPLSVKMIKEDTPTHANWINPYTGQVMRSEPKNIKEAEALKAEGKIQGPTRANMPLIENAANTILSHVTAVEKHPGLNDAVGQFKGQLPTWVTGNIPGKTGENFRDFKERMGQIGGETWTQGIKTMVNLGALSNAEGQRITEATARLSTAKSKEAFLAALKDVKDTVRQGLEASQAIANGRMKPKNEGQQPAPTAPTGPTNLKQKYGLE